MFFYISNVIYRTFFENYNVKSSTTTEEEEEDVVANETHRVTRRSKKDKRDDSVIYLISDDEQEGDNDDDDDDEILTGLSGRKPEEKFVEWYETYMAKLERQYPTAFEMVVKESVANCKHYSSSYMEAIKLAIGKRKIIIFYYYLFRYIVFCYCYCDIL